MTGPAPAVSQVQPFALTVPANTPISSPVNLQMNLLPLDIVWLEWRVPPGPRGDVGFYFGSHGAPIIPYGSGPLPWIITDDEGAHWDLVDQPNSGDWNLVAYNIGLRPHTIYVRWGLADLSVPVLPAVTFNPVGSLTGAVPGA